MKTKYLKDVEIFWDNGKYVAIITDSNGVRRNVAMENAKTKIVARIQAKEYLGIPLSRSELARGYYIISPERKPGGLRVRR